MKPVRVTRYRCDHCGRSYATKRAAERHESMCLRDPESPQPGALIVASVPAVRYVWYGGEIPPFGGWERVHDEDDDLLYGVVIEHRRRRAGDLLLVWPAARRAADGTDPESPEKIRVVRLRRSQVLKVLGSVPLCPGCGDPLSLPPSGEGFSVCDWGGHHCPWPGDFEEYPF